MWWCWRCLGFFFPCRRQNNHPVLPSFSLSPSLSPSCRCPAERLITGWPHGMTRWSVSTPPCRGNHCSSPGEPLPSVSRLPFSHPLKLPHKRSPPLLRKNVSVGSRFQPENTFWLQLPVHTHTHKDSHVWFWNLRSRFYWTETTCVVLSQIPYFIISLIHRTMIVR